MNVKNSVVLTELLEGMSKTCNENDKCIECVGHTIEDGKAVCRYSKMFKELVSHGKLPNQWDLKEFYRTLVGGND